MKAAVPIIGHEAVDEREQAVERLANGCYPLTRRMGRLVSDKADHVGGIANDSQGRAEFMTDHSQEIRLLVAQRTLCLKAGIELSLQQAPLLDLVHQRGVLVAQFTQQP